MQWLGPGHVAQIDPKKGRDLPFRASSLGKRTAQDNCGQMEQ